MKFIKLNTIRTTSYLLFGSLLCTPTVHADETPWSIVPYVGVSVLGDQTPTVQGAGEFASGEAVVSTGEGFTAGISLRYEYEDSPWSSEFGWEYRSNDSETTSADGLQYNGGNYASNTFYINGRYALTDGNAFAPWIGGGLSLIQEVDLDAVRPDSSLSFSTSGNIGFQAMVGVDYALTERLYLTSELRYTSFTGLALDDESNTGLLTGMDYQPVTIGLGLGFRF